ncbi:hypothetical protein AB6A40_004195 [Gnathostoma spinigerum]|uniref:Sorting nexin n=1 Tax=Gnathostoma spinigerum TaxID=75299 RepID=A0ABD6EJA1_9BILA
MEQVRAVYSFEAQPNSGEMSITANEVLTVVRRGIEGGWLEGRNAKGQSGLFPESYVETMIPVSIPPRDKPPPLPLYAVPPGGNDDWDNLPPPPAVATYPSLPSAAVSSSIATTAAASRSGVANYSQEEDDFDDWSDDDEEVAEARLNLPDNQSGAYIAQSSNRSHSRATSGSRTDLSTEDEGTSAVSEKTLKNTASIKDTLGQNEIASTAGSIARSRSAGPEMIGGRHGTVRMKTINLFSNFVKSGMESFILSTAKMSTDPFEKHEIILSDSGPEWLPLAQCYHCTVDRPKKESKLKGLKSFIAYTLTSSLNNIQVSRRYKHFDWLHEQMSAKYILIPMPPLPEKQVSGRYEEDLIEHRKNIFQLWVNKVCRHPVLSRSDVWNHFLTCTDEKQWKNGKRKAEKDEYVGGNFLNCVTVPSQPLDSKTVEAQVEDFSKCIRSLDDSIRIMFDRFSETHKRMTGPYKANWQKVAHAFAGLGDSFELDPSVENKGVTSALKQTANVFHKIGEEHERSARTDLDPLMDCLYTYKGQLSTVPDIINVHKTVISKLHENERLCEDRRISAEEAEKIRKRVDKVSYVVLAEMKFQHKERGEDFKQMMIAYLSKQSAFYLSISQQLADLAKLYNSA